MALLTFISIVYHSWGKQRLTLRDNVKNRLRVRFRVRVSVRVRIRVGATLIAVGKIVDVDIDYRSPPPPPRSFWALQVTAEFVREG